MGLEVPLWVKTCSSTGTCSFMGSTTSSADGSYSIAFEEAAGGGPYSLFIPEPQGAVFPDPTAPATVGSVDDGPNLCCASTLSRHGVSPEATIVFDPTEEQLAFEGLDFEVELGCEVQPEPLVEVKGRVTCLGTDLGLDVELWVRGCSSTGGCRFLGAVRTNPDGTYSKTFLDPVGGSHIIFVPDPPGPVLPMPADPAQLGLIGTASPDVGHRGGSLLFRVELSSRASLNTPRTACTPPVLSQVQSVAFAVT